MTTFRAADVAQIAAAACRLNHRDPALMEAIAAHVLRGMVAYPLFALCNVANCFARLEYSHRGLMDAIAGFLAEPSRAEQLFTIDIASLVFAFGQLGHSGPATGALLETCAARLQQLHHEIGGPNCATILNSYARLSECNPELFKTLARSAIETRPESFEVHHISVIMNAFAKCSVRRPQTMHLLGGFLEGRINELSPQNVANIANAFAKLDCYNHELFVSLQRRLVQEDLSAYKLYELAILTHSLAKLKFGGAATYSALFGEAALRTTDRWEPQSVAQLLDAMRRKHVHLHEPLAELLVERFLRDFRKYAVHPLTQTAWCLVELEVLDLAGRAPPEAAVEGGLPQRSEDEGAALWLMRAVLERMEEQNGERALTATQQKYVQQLIRDYHYKHEVDYGLLPQRTKAFCKSLFDVPSSVVASVARKGGRGHGGRGQGGGGAGRGGDYGGGFGEVGLPA